MPYGINVMSVMILLSSVIVRKVMSHALTSLEVIAARGLIPLAKIDTHREDCLRILGDDFLYIHEWLDEFAKKWKPQIYLEYHRKFRHHSKGVAYVKKKWGFYAEQAAKLHIIRDNEMYLPTPVIDIMREDMIDELYKKALNFCHPPMEVKDE